MRSLALKKLRLDYEAGISLKRRNLNMSLFLSSGGVKENRKILLCKKSGGNSRIVHSKTKTQGFGTRGIEKIKSTQCLNRSDKACG